MDLGAEAWIAVATLVVAAALFLTKLLPIGVTALSIPVVLVATGVISHPSDALRGFGNHAVIAIGSIFVVGGALQESGVATLVARGLQRVAKRSELRLLVFVMLAAALLSAFINNAAAVALLLPAVVALSRRTLVQPGRLLMPLAYSAVLGGTVTMIGTAPNLIVANSLREFAETDAFAGVQLLGVFDFALVGLPIVAVGVVYMATVGRRLLPERAVEDRLRDARLPEEVASSYGLTQNLFQMRVVEGSGVAGKTIAEAAIRSRYGLSIVMVVRPGAMGTHRYLHPTTDLLLLPEDRLYLDGEDVAAWNFAETELLQFGLAGPQTIEEMLGRGVTLAEVTVPPRSGVVGKSLRELEFRKRFHLGVLSLWRRGSIARKEGGAIPLQEGDVFLVSGHAESVDALARHPDFTVLTDQSLVEDVGRAPLAICLLLVALVPPIVGWLPISISALAAALLMVVTGCITSQGLRRAVDWKVLALIVGTVPLGVALQEQGVAAAAADGILSAVQGFGTPAVLAALFLLAAVVAMLSTNAASAVVVTPVAAQAALAGGLDLRVALLAVAYGCSCAFILPFAQWNLLVMGPGGYKSGDYLKVGLGLSLVVAVTAVGCLSLL